MASNVKGIKRGWHYSNAQGTMGFFVDGYLRELWHGKTGAKLTMPSWYEGETGWDNMQNPNIYTEDTTETLPRGTRLQIGERVFYYATYYGKISSNTKADTAGDDLLGKGLFNFGFAQDYSNKLTGASGSTSITLADTVAGTPTERVNNFYSGGWLNVKDTAPSDARFIWRYIEASTISSTTTTLTIDQPLVNAITGGNSVLTPNPYKYASWFHEDANAAYHFLCGFSMVNNPTASAGIWLQTYGPMGTNNVTNAFMGASEGEVQVYCMADGSIQVRDGATDTYALDGGYPLVGHIMPSSRTESGSGQDETYPIVYLTLRY